MNATKVNSLASELKLIHFIFIIPIQLMMVCSVRKTGMDVQKLPALVESSAMMFLLLVWALHVDNVQLGT